MRAPLLALVASCAASFAAAAQDRFEIQVYDSEVAEPGSFGLELHTNYVVKGTTETSAEGELPTRHVLHTTLEPHVGLFGWAELGGYLQGALRPDGSVDFAGVKLRFKAKWPRKFLDDKLGLSVNFELSRVPAGYETNVWGTEVRPTVDLREGPIYLSVNPIVSTDLQGPLAGHPQFEPAAKIAFFLSEALSLGAESYSGFGAFDALLPAAQQSHQLYGVLDLATAWFDLNAGVGRGFDAGTPWVAKAIFGFHSPAAPPSHIPPPGSTPGH